MTSPSPSQPRPRRRAAFSRTRMITLVVLAAAAVLSLTAAFLPGWLPVGGIFVALAAAVAIFVLSRVELAEAATDYRERVGRLRDDHRAGLTRLASRHERAQAEADTMIGLLEAENLRLRETARTLRHELVGTSRGPVAGELIALPRRRVAPSAGSSATESTASAPRVIPLPAVAPGWDNLEVESGTGS